MRLEKYASWCYIYGTKEGDSYDSYEWPHLGFAMELYTLMIWCIFESPNASPWEPILGRCLSLADSLAIHKKVPCWWIWHMIWWFTMMDYSMSGRIDHFLRSTQTHKDIICRGSTPNGTPTDSTKIYVFHKGRSIHSCWERGFPPWQNILLGVQPLLFQGFQLTPWNQTCFPFISFCTPETYPKLQSRTFPLRMELNFGGLIQKLGGNDEIGEVSRFWNSRLGHKNIFERRSSRDGHPQKESNV